MQLLLFWSAVLQAVAQDYLYEKLTGGGSTCSAGFNDITSSADCQTAATEGQGTWNTALSSAAYPSGCSYEVASGDIFYNSLVVGALVPDGTTYAIICRQSTTTITTSSVTITTTSQTTKTDTTTSFSSTSTSSTSTSSSSTSSSSSTTSSTTSSSTSSTSSSSTSTSSTSSSSTSTSSSTTSSTSITSTTTTTSTTPPDIFNVTWVQSYVRPVTNAEIAISCYPTSCNEHAIAFLAAIDPLSVNFVDTTCASVTEMPLQPMTVYDSVSARVVVRMTQPQYLSPQEGSSPIVDYKSAWEPVVDWTVNWTLQVVEGTELRMGRSYRLCIDESGPGGYNGPQLGDVTEMIEVYVAGIREADDGIAPSNNSRVEVLCEPTGDLYQLGCQTFMGYNEQSNPGATSAYLAVSCDTSDNDGWRESLLDNESASSYLMGDGNPYFYLEFDTRDMQLGVHYRLCEDLDGTGTVASFNWPGIVVYLGGVTSLSTVLRDPKDGPVVTAALGQGLLLNCLYGSCSTASEAYLALSCEASDNSTDRSESAAFTFRGSSEEWQWELGMWDLSNLTNGSTYKLCTDLDGLAQGPLHSGFSGLWVPVTPVTQISEESIQAATDQHVLLLCYGCWNTERYCDTVVGCPATDPIYEVSSAYLTTKACNFSDNDGFQMDEGDWTTLSAPLRPTSNSTRGSSLSASPGKEAVVYNTEVIFDASATVIGTRYRLCLDLDGAGTRFSFHDTGFSVYVTPVSVVRHQVLVIGLTSRLEFSCHGTGTVSTSCSTASAVYLAQRCDLNRETGVLGDWEIHDRDATPTQAVTQIPGAEGSIYEFRVELNTTHLQVGWTYRLCIDTDTSGELYFGDSGFEVTISGVEAIYPADSLKIGSSATLDLYCPLYCSSETLAYLAQEAVGCDSSASGLRAADGALATASAALVAAVAPDSWQVASYFTRDWTVTFNTSALKPGDSYLLCVDYDGAQSTALSYANAYDGVVKMNPITAEYTALEASSTATLPLTCDGCNLSTIIYLATACDVAAVISGNKENCQTYWNLVPPQTCSQLLEASFPSNTAFVRLFPRSDLPGFRWTAQLDTSGLTVGVNYRLCADLDGGFTEQGFLDVGQVMITGVQKSQRSISTAATRHEWTGGSNQALVLTCSSYCTVGTTLISLASTCDSSSDNSPLKTAQPGEQTAPVTLEMLSSWAVELLPQRHLVLYGQDNSALDVLFVNSSDSTDYVAMLDTSGLTAGRFYRICVDHDGTGNWFVGDTGLRVLATDLVVDVSIHHGQHEALSINCTLGCSELVGFLSLRCDEASLSPFANAHEGTGVGSLSRFGGPRLFNDIGNENETNIITGDTYQLYLDTSILTLGQTYALCVDYDGTGNSYELGDSGRRVYVTGVTGFVESGRIFKDLQQTVQLHCNPGECSSSMRVYLGLSCDFTTVDGSQQAAAGMQTDAVDLHIAGLEEDADDRGGLAASATALEVLEAAPLRQVPVVCSDCSTSSSVFLSISCDAAVLPELNHTDGTQAEVIGFATSSVNLWGTAPSFWATLDAGRLRPGALYTICLDKDGTATSYIFEAYGQVQVSSPVPHRWQFTVDASGLNVGNHYKVCLDADGSGSLGWGDTGLEVYVSGVLAVSPSVITRGANQVFNITCDPGVCSSTPATTAGGVGRSSAYLAWSCDREVYDGIIHSFDRILPASGVSVNVYNASLTTFSTVFYGSPSTKFNMELFQVSFDTNDLLPGYHLTVCTDLDGQQVDNAFGPSGVVYVSGVRSSSTPQISAAAAQRIELTCDADACGAQGAIGYLAINCTDYETRHGGVSVGAVDELNHFSGQMLPVGEAKILGNYSAVEVESADLIRIPSAAGQTITFHCIQDCSEASTAYVGTGCDSNATGFKMAEFGVQTSSVDLVAHWESSHWSTTLDASSLTPGLHYNLCVDPDGAGSEFNFGDTGVRLFVQGAYTPPVPFYGSLTYWYFDADAQHLAPGRSYRICTDLDGRHGPMQGGDTGLEVYVNSVEALEFQSVLKASSASVGLACSGCVASNDTQAPSFDGANSFPAHGSSVSRRTNVVLAFSEAIQLGYGGIFQIWDSGLTASPVYEITVADIYAANAAAGGSLVRENKVYITPATLCNVPASCFLFTNTRSYYVVAPEGTVYDLAGNVLPALNTAGTWQWTTVNVFTDADPPEVAMSSHVEVIDSFAHGFVIFTEDVSFSGATDLELLDCGTDFDCSSTSILTGGSKTTTLTPFVDGVTDLATIRAQKQDFGLLEFRYELPPVSPRRFQLRVPVDYVTDTANPTGLTGPSSIYEITFDVGMPYGQEVLPVTSGTQLFLASHCNSTETETYFWGYSPGVSSPVVTLQSNSGSYSFLANFNTADLAAGVHYEVCLDVDGPGPLHRPGPTGLQLFVSPVTAVAPTTVTQDLGRTVIVTCPTVCSTSTYMYLGIDCEEISSPGVVPETPPFRTRSAPLRSTGTSGEFSLTFDAANLTAGVYYHLCLDVDGSSQTRYYGDSRHTVYISAVAGLRSPRIRWSLTAPLSVACFARPQEAMGWWPENDTEEELMVGVQNFTKNYVNQLHWCNELTTAYLATSCDTAVADGYSNALWSERTQSQSFSGTDHLVVWPDVSFVDEERNETESSEVGYRNDAACAHAATERGYAYWTRRASDNTCWFLTESAPAYASFSEGYTSGMVGVQLWLLRLDTRPLLQGQYYTLCIDLDGYQTISSVATTLLSVYVSPVQAVSTTTVWQALNQNISLECSNCTSSTKLTLSVKCDGTMVVGEIPGEQTLVTTLDSNGDEGMWTAIVDAKTLAEGKHYRVCLELDDLMPMGDTGYRIYVTPLYYVTPSVGSEQFQQIEVACPSAICTRSTEIRLGLLHQSCGDGLLDEVETTWVQVEGAAEAKDLRPSRLRGGLDAAVLSAGRGRGAYFFVVDTRDLEVDQNYRVCIDIDGVSGDVYQPGDAGYLVWKPDTTAPFVFGNGTFNGTLEWNVTEAATYLAGRRLDATEEETREVELSRAEASRWWAQRSSEQQNDESSSKSARLDTSAKAAFVDPEAASSHSDLERRLSFVSPVESLYPEFVFLEPTVESENTSEPSLELLPMRRVNFTVTCSSGGCSTATEVRLALSCGSEGHRSSSPSYTQAVGLAYGAFPSNVLSPSGEAFQANLDVSTLLPGFDYRLCIDLDGYYGSSVPGDSGFSAHGSAISALWPSTLQLQSAQPLRVNCSAASGCSAALRGYLSSSACEARTDGLQSALSGVRTESVPASLVGDNSYELIFNTESLTVGQHYRLCVDFDGIGAVQGFGAVGIVYLSDTLASVTTALPFGATTAELQLSCPACTSSSSLMLALDCGDRVDVTNAASSLGVVSSSFAALSGTSWSAHFDTTTLTPGIQYHLCLDLDGTTGSLALGTTGFMVYVTPVTECWRCAIRPAQQQQLILSCPSCSGPASGYVESRNNSWNLSELVNFSVEELVKWLDVLPAYDFAPQVFLARSSCEKGPKRLRPKQSNAGCWENLTLGQVDLACSRSNGTSGDVSWEQEENSFEATLSHWSHLFVAVVDASGLVPGEEYLICLDLDGLGKPMPYGDTGLRTYVSPVTSAWVAGSFPRHLAVSQTSFTLEVSCEDLGTCLPYAWLWLDTSCSSRLSGAALEVQVLWPAQVTLDASGFQYGDLLHLCTDWGAVAGARPGSDTGFSIFVSPVDVVSPLAIEARADQIISISCVAGCRSATTVHLASHSCDTSSSTRASRSALLQSPQRLGLSTAELVWTAALDATDFQPGSSLLLCADMDGSGDTFAAGDTGVRIYVKGWASASMAIRAADAQQVLVSCLDCSAVTKIARAYVAEHCGRVQATEKTFPLVETTGGLAFLVDASMLTKGITARLCATLGEQTLPPFTDTALEIFVSPFSDIVPTRLTVGTGQIRLKCDHFVCPAETTWVRLATTCGQDAAEQLEVAAQSDAANSLVARFETSSLTAGRRYHVCIQVGTQPLGDTGRRIYLSNVSEVTPGSLRAAPAQEICFVCPQCSSAAMLRVAASCSDALEACLPWQRIHEINYTTEADFWNPSLSGVIHPDMLVLKNYDPYPGVLEAVANGTWSNETYSPPCARALRGTGGTVQMPLQPKSGATNGWCAILDGTPLETGVSYNLCLDLDGAGPLESGSVQEVFAAPDQMLSSGVEPSTVTQGVDIQRLRIGCALRCSEVTQAYLATSCEEALSRTAVARYLERLASRDGSAWLLPVNVSSFESGRHYKICIDLDGPSPGFLAGDSGLEVYVNGVVALDPLAVNQAAAQKIRFSCPTCAATATVSMYLARSTCTTHASDLPQLQLEGQRNLTLTLNAQSLEVGMSYRLCVDMDSGKAGDVGEIYVSPIVMTSFTLVWAAAARVVFECTFCRVESLVHLSADCQEPLSYPYPAGTLVQSTQRTLVANLFRDESDPSRLGVWWYADLQTEVLTAGLEYHLCLDLDGQGSLPAGDTGIPVFVNPVSELSQVVIRPALQSFNFVCSACEVGVAKLYLASTCSTPLTAQSTIYHDSPSRADTARRSALDASPLPKGRHYEVCVTASAVSAAVPAATLLLSPVEEVTPLVLRQVDTAQRLLLQCQGCSSLTVARLSSSCATGASGTESAALVLARSGMLADAGITNTAPTRTADGSYRAWWSLTVDATSLTAGLPHKICLDLDGLASVSHGFIDLEEQIYISPILQLKTSSIRAQQQQVLSFQCKVKCAGQFVGNPVLLLATQCDTSDFTGTARAVALRSTAAVPIRVDPVNQLAQPNGWYSAAIDASQLTVGQSYRICLDMDGSLKSLALGDSGLSVLVTA